MRRPSARNVSLRINGVNFLRSRHQWESAMTFRAFSLAGAAVAIAAMMSVMPAFAHHSFAMFDGEKTKVLEGTVKEFQWTNPHSWIVLTVHNAEGQPEQ
jgi:hypothetical protein